MKKILIVLNNDMYFRNYISSGSFRALKQKFKLYYCIKRGGVSKIRGLGKKEIAGFVEFKKKELNYYNNFCIKYLIKNLYRSNTIYLSFKRIKNFKFFLNLFPSDYFFIKKIYAIFFYFFRLCKIAIYFVTYRFLGKNIVYKKKINPKIKEILQRVKPDLVLIPTQGHDISYFEFTVECKEKGIKTCALVDNWDNLSSRVHPDPKPDNFFVWGKQSKTFGKNFQYINSNKIHILGTPRYENYFENRKKKLKSYFDFKYILFVEGFGIQEDLNFFFQIVEKSLNNLKKKGINLKLIYRPHPWRKHQQNIDVSIFKNIKLDPQLKYFYEKKLTNSAVQPDLGYYPSLIKNASLIIAAPSTMVIESSIFWKKIILLAYDKYEIFGNFAYLKNIEHFKGISSFPNIFICKNIHSMESLILYCLKKKINRNQDIDKLRNYYLFKSKLKYSLELYKLIKKVYKF